MFLDDFSFKCQKMGRFTCRAVFVLGLAYTIITILGLLSLKSPEEPIGNPYFTIMEILTILIAPLMTISMVAVHYYASRSYRVYSLVAILLMLIMTGITSSVHFIILTSNLHGQAVQMPDFFFSFKWFSVAYALDILAWDWFFALSFLFASFVFKTGRIEKVVRVLMIISGSLSLAGLIGVPLDNMQIRNIGIIGYAIIAPVVFLLIGKVLSQEKQVLSA